MTTKNGSGHLPAFQARNLPPMPQRELHPAAQEAAAAWSDMMHALEAAQADNAQLKADLAVERRHVVDLQRLLDAKAAECHRAQRYAIEVRTHLKHVIKGAEGLVTVSLEADACAMAFSQEEPEQPAPRDDAVQVMEKALAGAVAESNSEGLAQ